MFALPGVLGLLVFLYLRPTDIFESLRGYPFLPIFLGLAVVGVAFDLRLGVLRLTVSPLTKLVCAWAAWSILVTATRGIAVVMAILPGLLTILAFFFVLANGAQTMKALNRIVILLLICIGCVTTVAVHQSTHPRECVALDPRDPVDGPRHPDGRPCNNDKECPGPDAPIQDADYVCEKVGLFGITSLDGRARYTGTLHDPNEVALSISIGIPILYLLYERKRSWARAALGIFGTAAIIWCVIETGSRGGLLVFGAVVIMAAARWTGWKGVACILAIGVGGLASMPPRHDAEDSSTERAEAAFVGLTLVKQFPVRGVGMGQYREHHYITAHNAYLLTTTEGGIVGGALWASIVYMCFKIAVKAYFRYRLDRRAQTASQVAWVLLNSFAGMAVGVFFLSFAYNYVFWTYVGVTAAFYGAIRLHDPKFTVTMSWREFVAVAFGEGVVLTALFLYTKRQAGL